MACRVGRALAVIAVIPSGFGPDLLCGELRDGKGPLGCGKPWRAGIRVAPNTDAGMTQLLASLQRLATTGR